MSRNEQKGYGILFPLEGLECYIEKLGKIPDFQEKRQLSSWAAPKEQFLVMDLESIEDYFRTQLIFFLQEVINSLQNNDKLRENQEVFHQWLDYSGITAENCPEKLKHFLLEIEDILEKQSLKLYDETSAYLWRKDKKKPYNSQEATEGFRYFSKVAANPPKLYLVDMKDNAEAGKKVLEQIATSLSQEERKNFHFYPPLTDEEKAEYDEDQKEGKENPVVKGQRINAIEEIKNALQREPRRLTINDLDPENQGWENEINRTEKITEIENVKGRVLADIESKKCQDCRELRKQLTKKEDKIKQLEQEIAELEVKVIQQPDNSAHKVNLNSKKMELIKTQEELKQLISSLPTPNNEIISSKDIPWPWILGIGGSIILLGIFGIEIYLRKKKSVKK